VAVCLWPGAPRCPGGDCDIERDVRVNERIRAREVRVIDENGAQLGIFPVREALRIARERELDLIEVAPTAQPPVCRIMDYGKHKYQTAKREREAHKRIKPTEVRLLRLKPQIGPHDLDIKVKKLHELLGEGNKVRIQLRFRGRELSHPELGTQLLNRIAAALTEVSLVESSPRFEGRMMNMLLSPKARPKPAAQPKPAPAEKAEAPVAGAPQPAAAGAVKQEQAPAMAVAAQPERTAAAVPAQPAAVAAAGPMIPQSVATTGSAQPEKAITTGPARPEKASVDGKEQVQRALSQNEDTEDSGEAG